MQSGTRSPHPQKEKNPTKMNTMNTPRLMSDTPKTDEFILSCVRTDYNWQILARNLERELNATTQDRADFGALVDKLERELNAAKEFIREIRDNEVNAVDEATKFLRDYPLIK